MRTGRSTAREVQQAPRGVAATLACVVVATSVGVGCAGVPARVAHVPRLAMTLFNEMPRVEFCRVGMQSARGGTWVPLALRDTMAPGTSRTVRIPHGRWRFRFERCGEPGMVITPPVDVATARVVVMLCDGVCTAFDGPSEALTFQFNRRRGTWQVVEPVYESSGRRPWRLVL